MRDNDAPTEKIIAWALSRPVLTKWLAVVIEDGTGDDLPCMVVELLDPVRGPMAVAFLNATAAPLHEADALWTALGSDPRWMAVIDWDAVRAAILDAHADACAWLCDHPHPTT